MAGSHSSWHSLVGEDVVDVDACPVLAHYRD